MRGNADLERTKVEDKVADGHQSDSSRCTRPAADAEVYTAGNDEEDAKGQERPREPLSSGKAVGSEDEARASRDGCKRDSEEILLGLFNEDVVDGVAGQRHIRLPRGEPLLLPCRHGRVAVWERRVPARQ